MITRKMLTMTMKPSIERISADDYSLEGTFTLVVSIELGLRVVPLRPSSL